MMALDEQAISKDGRQRMPDHGDLWDAYRAGVMDGQKNRQASPPEIEKAADGYVKLWVERRPKEPA